MRPYAPNSPQSAARIIALTLVADGDVGKEEFALLEALQVPRQLGLEPDSMNEVFDNFCVDLLASKQLTWADSCPVDERTLAGLMDDIDDPALRRKVLAICVRIAEADGHIAEGESIVLSAAVEHWGLQRHMLHLPDAGLPLQGYSPNAHVAQGAGLRPSSSLHPL